jgi:hypothetical protein
MGLQQARKEVHLLGVIPDLLMPLQQARKEKEDQEM